MATALIISSLANWFRLYLLRKENRNQKSKHRSAQRATWTVYIRRYWNGCTQTHRAWADMGTSVWELVSIDTARKYGRQPAWGRS